jgi:Na+-transporting NADH:ubiquinone oxidoreductase subunit C
MAIDRNSNKFTFIFAIIMVVVVGTALSYVSLTLKPLQVQNSLKKEMINILGSVGVEAERENAEELFYANITQRITLNYKGEVVKTSTGQIDPKDAADPFNVDVQKEFRDTELAQEERNYPIYLAEVGGKKLAVIPMVGKGLWGPIWGYIALEEDFNTVFGAVFNHKSETPGLGAEINENFFQEPFEGKKIYDESGDLVSINVKKGGADPSNPHAVDGITGGTITSNGVSEMLKRTLGIYDTYFQENKTQLSELK